MTTNPRQVRALAIQTRQPPISALPSPFASLATPKFGRLAKDARDHYADPADALAERPSEHPVMAQASSQQRCLSDLLHDPAAAALFLRTHMKPDDLMELILILANAAADVLRARRAIYNHHPPRERQPGSLVSA